MTAASNPVSDNELAYFELEVRRAEAQAKLAQVENQRTGFRRWLENPLTLLIAGGIITLAGNMGLAYYNGKSARDQQSLKATNELQLEREKAKANLIIQAISSNDPIAAKRNIKFFVESGVIIDNDGRISRASDKYMPVLPSSGAVDVAPMAMLRKDIDYTGRFWTATLRADRIEQVDALVDRMVASRKRFETVGAATNTPWYIVAVIWSLEGGEDFSRHLVNGDPLTARTVHVPVGRPATGSPPFTWEDSAIDTFASGRLSDLTGKDISKTLNTLERYNGTGYRLHKTNSPYLWSGTSEYVSGFYGPDGRFEPNRSARYVGAVAILRRMMDRNIIILDRSIQAPTAK